MKSEEYKILKSHIMFLYLINGTELALILVLILSFVIAR